MKVTYGADPEFFVVERDTLTVIPACGLFGGEKGNPVLLSEKGGYLEDGVTIEFNVSPSATIAGVRADLLGLIDLWHKRFPKHKLIDGGMVEFNPISLRKLRGAMEIGCAADLSAWGTRRSPQISDLGGMRFAGGHIHIGMDPWPEVYEKPWLIKYLDLMAYLPNARYANPTRYKVYGLPGLYRSTGYGVEYRSPENTWVYDQANGKQVGAAVEKAVSNLLSSKLDPKVIKERFRATLELLGLHGNWSDPSASPWDAPTINSWPRRWFTAAHDYGNYILGLEE